MDSSMFNHGGSGIPDWVNADDGSSPPMHSHSPRHPSSDNHLHPESFPRMPSLGLGDAKLDDNYDHTINRWLMDDPDWSFEQSIFLTCSRIVLNF